MFLLFLLLINSNVIITGIFIHYILYMWNTATANDAKIVMCIIISNLCTAVVRIGMNIVVIWSFWSFDFFPECNDYIHLYWFEKQE